MPSGPILVIAGAGSGKTRTLVHRVAWLVERGINPEQILLLTFTRRAAEEMLARARQLHPLSQKVAGGTFHSLCHRLLRQYSSYLQLPPHFTVLDRADGEQMLRGLINELGLKDKGDRHFPKPATILDIISKARNLELELPDTVLEFAGHLSGYLPAIEQLADLFARQKMASGLLDYDDLLYFTQDLLIQNREIRAELGRRWQHLLIDEYQDTNAVQARLVELLATGHNNVMVVGDDAQSIYRFRGARIENILEFPRKFKNVQTVKLEENYRSTQSILDLTNHIIAASRQGFAKRLFSNRQGGQGKPPLLLRPRGEREQSQMVVERIIELLRQGVKPKQIAVLFRSSYDSYQLEVELNSQQLAFIKVGGYRFLEASHIKDTLGHLRVLANPYDFVSWQRILLLLPGVGPKRAQSIIARLGRNPPDYLNYLREEKASPPLSALIELLATLNQEDISPLRATERVIAYYEPICIEQYEDYPRRLRDLAEIANLAEPYHDLAQFMAEVVIEPPNSRQSDMGGEHLTLSTVHSAKGLEWDFVFILWADQGRFPPLPALLDPESLEEERRLMYVATTRAAAELTILAPSQHYTQGQGLINMPLSCFLEDVPAELLQARQAAIFKLPTFAREESGADKPAVSKPSRPFAIGANVEHGTFGSGKVMGYKGEQKILVHFNKVGLKILLLEFAGLKAV